MTDEESSSLSTAIAVVISKLDDVREDIQELKKDTVSRREYDERNRYVDTRLTHKSSELERLGNKLEVEVTKLHGRINAKSAPWWTVAALIVSAGALGWAIIGPV